MPVALNEQNTKLIAVREADHVLAVMASLALGQNDRVGHDVIDEGGAQRAWVA